MYELVDGLVFCFFCLIVNYSEAGIGDIEAAVRNVGKEVVCEVNETEYNGIKTIEFVPQNSGMFFVYCKFNNTEITGCLSSGMHILNQQK